MVFSINYIDNPQIQGLLMVYRHSLTSNCNFSVYVYIYIYVYIYRSGAWAPEAAQALAHISRAAGGGAGGPTLLQETCVLVRSWRGRAALRRRAELVA